MSKSCKWVVIEESVYLDLISSLETKSGERVDKVKEKELGEEVVADIIEEEVLPEAKVEEAIVEEDPKEVEEEVKLEDNLDNKAVQSLPPSYRLEGAKLLGILLDSRDFLLGDRGDIYIRGKQIENYSLEKLLRTLCIPFQKGVVPRVLLTFLKEIGLTKFRNHLVKQRPEWEKRYSWRESTMVTRRGHAEDPEPSTPKRVKRVIQK